MHKFNVRFPDAERISFLQRKVLINSYLYYERDTNLISDKDFDSLCKELVSLQNKYNTDWIYNKTDYGAVFYDFDGTTGFHLWDRLKLIEKTRIKQYAHICLKNRRY